MHANEETCVKDQVLVSSSIDQLTFTDNFECPLSVSSSFLLLHDHTENVCYSVEIHSKSSVAYFDSQRMYQIFMHRIQFFSR